jgi:hypothetical protein
MAEDALDKFVIEIITSKNLPGLNDEVKSQLVADLKTRLLDQINRSIVDALPDDKIDEFNAFLDNSNNTDETVQQFIAQCGVDVKSITAKTMLLFRELYLQTAEEREA